MPPNIRSLLRNLPEPNPVLVRELKQFVRNRMLLYFMLCYLLMLSLVAIVAMIDFSMLSGLEWFTFGTGVMNAVVWFIGYLLFLAGFCWFLADGPAMGRFSGVIDRDFVNEVLKVCVPFSILMFDYAVTAFLLRRNTA